MSHSDSPPPPISTLTATGDELERGNAELRALSSEIGAMPQPRTQLKATALDGFAHELSSHRERTSKFTAARTHWAVLDAPRYARALE